jgi:hypothetical protein
MGSTSVTIVLGHNPDAINDRDRIERNGLLLIAGEIDRRTVARTTVVSLTIERRRIMDLEKELEQSAISGL